MANKWNKNNNTYYKKHPHRVVIKNKNLVLVCFLRCLLVRHGKVEGARPFPGADRRSPLPPRVHAIHAGWVHGPSLCLRQGACLVEDAMGAAFARTESYSSGAIVYQMSIVFRNRKVDVYRIRFLQNDLTERLSGCLGVPLRPFRRSHQIFHKQ